MLEIKNISKKYDDKKVLCDVSFFVEKGSIHGLLGENGVGKTTLMKCITGIYRTEQGGIFCDGEPVFDNPLAKRHIVFMPDEGAYFKNHTVERVAKLYAGVYPDFSKERFWTLGTQFELEAKMPTDNLSKGQNRRLAFALAIASGADYLILDEPTAGLDAKSKRLLINTLISETDKRDIGVLLSSHGLGDIEKLCDHVTVIKDESLLYTGDTDEFKGQFCKVSCIWEQEPAVHFKREQTEVADMENNGNIYTITAVCDFDALYKKLEKGGAKEIEKQNISLEECFLLANER